MRPGSSRHYKLQDQRSPDSVDRYDRIIETAQLN